MSMTEADYIYEVLIEVVPEPYREYLSRLHDLADPQSEEVRRYRKEVVRLTKELLLKIEELD